MQPKFDLLRCTCTTRPAEVAAVSLIEKALSTDGVQHKSETPYKMIKCKRRRLTFGKCMSSASKGQTHHLMSYIFFFFSFIIILQPCCLNAVVFLDLLFPSNKDQNPDFV